MTGPFAPAARDTLLARLGPDLAHPIGLSFAVVADADRLRTTVPARDASVARRLLERVIAHAR